jgi:hypothetical protein
MGSRSKQNAKGRMWRSAWPASRGDVPKQSHGGRHWIPPEQLRTCASVDDKRVIAYILHQQFEDWKMQTETIRETDEMMQDLRHFLEGLGDWMPKALVDSTVAESRARRLAAIAKDGLAVARQNEAIRREINTRANAILFSAGGLRNPEIANYLAWETDATPADAIAQLDLCVSEVPAGISTLAN